MKGLGVAPEGTTSNLVKQSDLDMLIDWGNKLGYVFVSNVLDSLDYGFPASRQRYYILGYRVRHEDKTFTQLQRIDTKTKQVISSYDFPRSGRMRRSCWKS